MASITFPLTLASQQEVNQVVNCIASKYSIDILDVYTYINFTFEVGVGYIANGWVPSFMTVIGVAQCFFLF